MLTREDVEKCYRVFLGRAPENEAVISDHLEKSTDIWTLIQRFTQSQEHQELRRGLRQALPRPPRLGHALRRFVKRLDTRIALRRHSLPELVGRYSWFHSIDLGAMVTPGSKSLALIDAQVSAYFGPLTVTGKSFLDIGAWNGAFSFAAKRAGASRVVAADSFTWNSKQFRAYDAFVLAREALGVDVKDIELDIEKPLPRLDLFDIVLFAGVFYHLRDPLAGLANAAALTRECLIVESYVDRSIPPGTMIFYPNNELDGDATSWWGPSEDLIPKLLKDLGFWRVESSSIPAEADRRLIFHAWR